MSVEYGDITSEEAIAFCLKDAAKAREDTLTLLQVSERASHSQQAAVVYTRASTAAADSTRGTMLLLLLLVLGELAMQYTVQVLLATMLTTVAMGCNASAVHIYL